MQQNRIEQNKAEQKREQRGEQRTVEKGIHNPDIDKERTSQQSNYLEAAAAAAELVNKIKIINNKIDCINCSTVPLSPFPPHPH